MKNKIAATLTLLLCSLLPAGESSLEKNVSAGKHETKEQATRFSKVLPADGKAHTYDAKITASGMMTFAKVSPIDAEMDWDDPRIKTDTKTAVFAGEITVATVKDAGYFSKFEGKMKAGKGSKPEGAPEPTDLTWSFFGRLDTGIQVVDLDTELDQHIKPYDYDDDALEDSVGAFIAWNHDHDSDPSASPTHHDHIGPLQEKRERLKDGNRKERENDLKLFKFHLSGLDKRRGELILSRSNGRIMAYSLTEDKAFEDVLTHDRRDPSDFNATKNKNGRRIWNLTGDGYPDDLEDIIKRGLWVEGVAPSRDLRDTTLSLEFKPETPNGTREILTGSIKITVVNLHMDYWTGLEDVGRIKPNDPLNKIYNPAVVVITEKADKNTVARFRIKALNAEGEPFFEDDSKELLWLKLDKSKLDWYGKDNTGTTARVSCTMARNVKNIRASMDKLGVKLVGAEQPFIVYTLRVAPLRKIKFRCNLLYHDNDTRTVFGVKENGNPAELTTAMDVANIIFYQAGIKLEPDTVAETDKRVVKPPHGTVSEIQNGYWKISGLPTEDVKIEVRRGNEEDLAFATRIASYNSRPGVINFSFSQDYAIKDPNTGVTLETPYGICLATLNNRAKPQYLTEEGRRVDFVKFGAAMKGYGGIIVTDRVLERRASAVDIIWDLTASRLLHETGHGLCAAHRHADLGPVSDDRQNYHSGRIPHYPDAWPRVSYKEEIPPFDQRDKNMMSYSRDFADFDLPQVMLFEHSQSK